MERVLSIYLRQWHMAVAQRPPDWVPGIAGVCGRMRVQRRQVPTLLYTTTARQETVAHACALCLQAGVRPGMTVAQAKALCPQALVLAFEAQRSGAALARLATWAQQFSPVVAVDPVALGHRAEDVPEGLLLDLTGAAHLWGGEALLLMEVAAQLARLGLQAQLAIAPTIGAAWALARFGRHALVRVERAALEAALVPLPVGALRLPPAVGEGLGEVNVRHIGELLRLPRGGLQVRFGPELLLRLDQALGRAEELLAPQRVGEPLAVRRVFDGAATQLEAVLLTIQELLQHLAARLAIQESGVRGLRVEWRRCHAPPVMREFSLCRPSRDPRHLWQLVRPKVEAMHLGYGVESVTLTAYWTQIIPHAQTSVLEQADATHAAGYHALLDTLVNRWGRQRVLMAHPRASHVPELARRFHPAGEAAEAPGEVLAVDRPALLLEPPEPAEGMALEPDHPPAWLRWRGQEYVLEEGGIGPERIVTSWWPGSARTRASTRDYFKVCTPGAAWLWVFRELESGRWFVHGVWV